MSPSVGGSEKARKWKKEKAAALHTGGVRRRPVLFGCRRKASRSRCRHRSELGHHLNHLKLLKPPHRGRLAHGTQPLEPDKIRSGRTNRWGYESWGTNRPTPYPEPAAGGSGRVAYPPPPGMLPHRPTLPRTHVTRLTLIQPDK